MEIKYGNVKITVPYEKYLLKHGMENPFGTMFSKRNQDLFEAFFKRAAADYANHLEEYKKWMDKFAAEMSKPEKSEE
ncbi:MAG TPA: hypothetical protein VHT96_02810 [Clostridia bacterium]|nr:hypothetical protein [Clostridia bacterium]